MARTESRKPICGTLASSRPSGVTARTWTARRPMSCWPPVHVTIRSSSLTLKPLSGAPASARNTAPGSRDGPDGHRPGARRRSDQDGNAGNNGGNDLEAMTRLRRSKRWLPLTLDRRFSSLPPTTAEDHVFIPSHHRSRRAAAAARRSRTRPAGLRTGGNAGPPFCSAWRRHGRRPPTAGRHLRQQPVPQPGAVQSEPDILEAFLAQDAAAVLADLVKGLAAQARHRPTPSSHDAGAARVAADASPC